MKKVLSVFFAFTIMLGVAGCQAKPLPSPASSPAGGEAPPVETGAPGFIGIEAIVTSTSDGLITFTEAEVVTSETYTDTDGVFFSLPYDATAPIPPIVDPIACILEIESVDDEYGGRVLSAAKQTNIGCILAETPIEADSCAGILAAVTNENPDILPSFMDMDESMLELYGITAEDVIEFGGKLPMMNVQAAEMFLCKVDTDHKQDVLDGLVGRKAALEEQWKQYLPAQYELVCNAQIVEYGDYLMFIVHEKAEALVSVVQTKLDAL